MVDLYRCLKWHTLETLINYHDYLLLFSIRNSNQPANLSLVYLDNWCWTTGIANPGDEDPLKGLLDQGVVTRQQTMGHIRRNNRTDGGTNSLRFASFVPRSVRLYNKLPIELRSVGIDKAAWKVELRRYCMEEKLGNSREWPNYDEMNGRILPSHKALAETGDMIVKKPNGLFIEPIPIEDPHHPGYANYIQRVEEEREVRRREYELAANRTDNRDLDRG